MPISSTERDAIYLFRQQRRVQYVYSGVNKERCNMLIFSTERGVICLFRQHRVVQYILISSINKGAICLFRQQRGLQDAYFVTVTEISVYHYFRLCFN